MWMIALRNWKEGDGKWHFLIMLLNKHGEERGEGASVEGEHIIIPMFGAIRSWSGPIEVEKVGANGKPII